MGMLIRAEEVENNIGSNMDSLPRDVVLQVFALLPPADLVGSVAAVCREWRALARDPDAWRTRRLSLSVRPHRALSPTERRVLRRTPALRALALSLRRTQDMPGPLSELLPACRHLRELQLTIPRLHGDLVADVRRHWPRLQELHVDASVIDDDAFEEMSRMQCVRRLHLSALQLQGCEWPWLRRLSRCASLRALHLNIRCAPEPEPGGAASAVELLCDRLTELHLGTLVPASDRLLAAIGQCSKLLRLHIEDCSWISDGGLVPLSQPIEFLCLRGLTAVSTGALYRFIYRSDLSRLQELQLPGCPALNDQALYLLARRCSRLPKLIADDCPHVSRRCYSSLWGSTSAASCGVKSMPRQLDGVQPITVM